MFIRLIMVGLPLISWAASEKIQAWSTYEELSSGFFTGVTLSAVGELTLGQKFQTWAQDLNSVPTAILPINSELAYVATSGPGQLWQVSPGVKTKLLFELRQPLITHLFQMPNGEIALISSPNGGVTYVRPGQWKKFRHVALPNKILGAYNQGDKLILVGDGNQIITVQGSKVVKQNTALKESQLRSVFKNYYGSAKSGKIYENNQVLFESKGEVVAVQETRAGDLLAALNNSNSSSEIWKLSKLGSKCLLWSSNQEIIHQLIQDRDQILWATGPNGHLYSSESRCKSRPDLLLSLEKNKQLTALALAGSKVLIGTADKTGLFELDFSKKAYSGIYESPVFAFDKPAQVLSSSGDLWLGNASKRDESWWLFKKGSKKEARFAQAVLKINANQPVSKIYFDYIYPRSYLKINKINVDQSDKIYLKIRAELESGKNELEEKIQFVLEPLKSGKSKIIKDYSKELEISLERSSFTPGTYRVKAFSEKEPGYPMAYSEWFKLRSGSSEQEQAL